MNDHCVVDMQSQVMRCEACGTETPLNLPMSITEVVRRADQFVAQHRRCRPRRQWLTA
jgi:hypothetical protein